MSVAEAGARLAQEATLAFPHQKAKFALCGASQQHLSSCGQAGLQRICCWGMIHCAAWLSLVPGMEWCMRQIHREAHAGAPILCIIFTVLPDLAMLIQGWDPTCFWGMMICAEWLSLVPGMGWFMRQM